MTKIDLDMDERLMSVGCLTVSATDCGETFIVEDARAQPKQENDRIVNEGEVVSLSRIKARALFISRRGQIQTSQTSQTSTQF
jgi:hypothetical protein